MKPAVSTSSLGNRTAPFPAAGRSQAPGGRNGYRRGVRAGVALLLLAPALWACGEDTPPHQGPSAAPAEEAPELHPHHGHAGTPARSPQGMVVSAKPLATEVGAWVLEEGGNAVDAAVATALALTVVEPSMSSIGGRTQILVRNPEGDIHALDGGNEVVAGYDPSLVPDTPDPSMGYGTVAIPGTVAALAQALERWGTWSFERAVAPAARLAEEGFILTGGQGARWEAAAPYLALSSGGATHFLRPDGTPYRGGERFRQPALAATLRMLAREGPEAFYRGEMARAIAQDVASNGGFLTAEDMAEYRVLTSQVVTRRYRTVQVVGSDLPASGAWVGRILELVEEETPEGFGVGGVPPVGSAPWAGALARALLAGFDERDRAWADAVDEPAHTTHLSVADGEGRLVALTQSIGPAFGSHVAHPEFGFLYASTQGYLVSEPGSRPFSSMSPLFILENGEPTWVLGGAGARRIVSAMVTVLSRGIDGGDSLEEAMAAPRFHALGGPEIRLEERSGARWGEAAREQLSHDGFQVSTSEVPDFFARLHAIRWDAVAGEWVGVADPRRVGSARGPQPAPEAPSTAR